MATIAQIRAQVDNALAALQTAIVNHQATYLANHGRYWQGLITHSVPPADGSTVMPDVGAAKPDYEFQGWPSALIASALPMALEIHNYDGPIGQGYVVILRVTINAQTHMRVAQVGPEPWRAQAWAPRVPASL